MTAWNVGRVLRKFTDNINEGKYPNKRVYRVGKNFSIEHLGNFKFEIFHYTTSAYIVDFETKTLWLTNAYSTTDRDSINSILREFAINNIECYIRKHELYLHTNDSIDAFGWRVKNEKKPNEDKEKTITKIKRKLVSELSKKIDSGDLIQDYNMIYTIMQERGYAHPEIFCMILNKSNMVEFDNKVILQHKQSILHAYRYCLTKEGNKRVKEILEQKTQFGTLTENGLINTMEINLNSVDSDDPLAYSYGYFQGKTGQKMEDSDDLAPEYIRGFNEGKKEHDKND